jgi:hypothetical protein
MILTRSCGEEFTTKNTKTTKTTKKNSAHSRATFFSL